MPLPKELSSIKRFGPRYGRTVKHKFALVEKMHRKSYKCPYCSKEKVRRLFAGVWQCEKCRAKFAGKAYTISTKRAVTEEMLEMPAEQKEEKLMQEEEIATEAEKIKTKIEKNKQEEKTEKQPKHEEAAKEKPAKKGKKLKKEDEE